MGPKLFGDLHVKLPPVTTTNTHVRIPVQVTRKDAGKQIRVLSDTYIVKLPQGAKEGKTLYAAMKVEGKEKVAPIRMIKNGMKGMNRIAVESIAVESDNVSDGKEPWLQFKVPASSLIQSTADGQSVAVAAMFEVRVPHDLEPADADNLSVLFQFSNPIKMQVLSRGVKSSPIADLLHVVTGQSSTRPLPPRPLST